MLNVKRLIPLAGLFFGLLEATLSLAQGGRLEDIPVDSWIYQAVFELSSSGHFPTLLLHTRPYTRGEIADAVSALDHQESSLNGGERVWLERLRREFHEELALSTKTTSDHNSRLGIGPTVHIDQFRHRFHKNRLGLDAIGSFMVENTAAARLRLRFDSDGRYDSQFHGEYWKEKFTAWVEQAVLTVRWRKLALAFGREYWRWGRSPHDVMLLSDHSPPFDGLRVIYRGANWSFAFHATRLDTMLVAARDYARAPGPTGKANRYLVAHRFNWRPHRNLELAVSEVMLYGGIDRSWEWNYLNPLLPYYWEQLNNDYNDNPLWNLEWSWRAWTGIELYGEWMIDDFQIDFTSEPHQIGILAGIAWTPAGMSGRLFLNGEYQRINTFTYGQDYPWNRYFRSRDINGDAIGIGSSLGTDADRWTLVPVWHLSPLVDLTALLQLTRRGEDRIDNPQATPVPKNLAFPSGIVERETQIGIGSRLQLGGNLIAIIDAGYSSLENAENIAGLDRDGVHLRFRLNALLWRTFGV